jgi:hypothetical protein
LFRNNPFLFRNTLFPVRTGPFLTRTIPEQFVFNPSEDITELANLTTEADTVLTLAKSSERPRREPDLPVPELRER